MEWTDISGFNIQEVVDDFGVLVVDDDCDCLQIEQHILEKGGFRVCGAKNAAEALRFLKTGRFSVMLTDYNMPGEDGLMLSEEALKIVPGMMIIMATGNCSPQLHHKAASVGISAVLSKPVNFKELLHMVQSEKNRHMTRRISFADELSFCSCP